MASEGVGQCQRFSDVQRRIEREATLEFEAVTQQPGVVHQDSGRGGEPALRPERGRQYTGAKGAGDCTQISRFGSDEGGASVDEDQSATGCGQRAGHQADDEGIAEGEGGDEAKVPVERSWPWCTWSEAGVAFR
jgi:hypothetical protein